MKPFGYTSIGFLAGALASAGFIYATFGHYREPQHHRNMGYLDAQYDIMLALEKHFGANGRFPGTEVQEVEPIPDRLPIFGLKTSQVLAAEKDGVPTLIVRP